ncbi:sensor histidine kinase [Halobacillus salinus]|uniref:histidine kinase n=1 Tax=Halobacillus salinus TaxID=192814 RepID=A0A4Z0H0L4_9BACI|nr:HAMP domain-containing sensor histidine kinase [Halobacillus salinus]TGB02642.1 HAMP domain-containing histidine kinase [Halobacillus salinus]
MKGKWRQSLQIKYLLLIVIALLVFPATLPFVSALVYAPPIMMQKINEPEPYGSYSTIEDTWHEEAEALSGEQDADIIERLGALQEKWPDSGVFWVGEEGKVIYRENVQTDIPEQWSQAYTVQFMKKSYDSDPFTVVAPIGEDGNRGSMVVQLDRDLLGPPITRLDRSYDFLLVIAIAILAIGFIVLSWFFFRKVHGRLKQLSVAMAERGPHGLPAPVKRTADDEIGELEMSFNQMVKELEESREREKQEESIRREWIASLSHDLRTPLTTIRASLTEVTDEVKSEKGTRALRSVNDKIDSLSHLIDNLLSVTLLTSHKYPYEEKQVEMNRLLRHNVAHWYAMFEQKDIEVEVTTTEGPVLWSVDPKWIERILDNLFQNVIRHAADGGYVGIHLEEGKLVVEDLGPGMSRDSHSKGAGVGLTIVDLMVSYMGLGWKADSSPQGTKITIENPDSEQVIGRLA